MQSCHRIWALSRLASSPQYAAYRMASNTPKVMPQIEVDEPKVQKDLGQIQMDFVKKAERNNQSRAKEHKQFRRTDWYIAAFCFSLIGGIYSYTMMAIKQEDFLDDFEIPDPMEEKMNKN